MSLAGGDLTTLSDVKTWLPSGNTSDQLLSQLITRCSSMIYSKLNRIRLYSQPIVRTFDGMGTYQIILPDWPVTAITKVQMGAQLIQPTPLPPVGQAIIPPNTFGYGYRAVLWNGNLPGDPTMIELVNGAFWQGSQNIQVSYQTGYLISNEAQTVPASPGPYTVTVNQPEGIWCRDNGITYANGTALTAVTGTPTVGQYNAPAQTGGGTYTFAAADTGQAVLISYSFIPADLEEACIQMVAERFSYRSRIGIMDQSLGGQETIRYMRGAGPNPRALDLGLPPEVESLISPYISTIPPSIGAPL